MPRREKKPIPKRKSRRASKDAKAHHESSTELKPHRSVAESHLKVKIGGGRREKTSAKGDRIAKVMARAGLCSRREAERWIDDGRVRVNGEKLTSPAYDVARRDRIEVDGQPLPTREPVRLWRYHKPKGLVTTHRDPQGRKTVFETLPPSLPRVISVGRLDYNTEGLLLLTNDGDLARYLELPSTGWTRRYRVRAHGRVTQDHLDQLKDGLMVDGVTYGPIEAVLDVRQGSNQWLTVGLREGKNREVRRVLGALGLEVNRLIRVSYGPFQLLDLKRGETDLVRRKILADQLGPKLAEQFSLTSADEDNIQHRRPTRSGKHKRAKKAGTAKVRIKASVSQSRTAKTRRTSKQKPKSHQGQAK